MGDKTQKSLGGPRLVISGDKSGRLRIWDAAGGENIAPDETDIKTQFKELVLPERCISELQGHEACIMDVKIVGSCVVSSSEDGTCRVFDLGMS